MASDPTIWKEVAARLSLTDAAQRLGIALKVGLQSSPFRQDKKPSFSVFRSKSGPLAFKDQADDAVKGGLFQFVKLATGWENKAVAKWLFEQSGVDPSTSEFSKGKAAEMRRLTRSAAYRARAEDLHKIPVIPVPDPWSGPVSNRWESGFQWLEKNAARIAKSRGWPGSVVEELLEMELMSGPLLPWAADAGLSDHSTRRATHGVAFRVDLPKRCGPGALEMIPVGYHQRFVTFGAGERGTSWTFVPYIPRDELSRPTEFQQALKLQGRSIPPLPFVLGCLDNPELVVILEGQWDAITFYHACGWFSDAVFPPVAVFGLRGVNGVDALLSFYADWLRVVKPAVWLIGDNDKAGRTWAERRDTEKIHSKPSFIDRLKALGARRVVYRVIAGKYGKDFNDFYRAANPDPEFMRRWMEKLDLVGKE